MEKMLDWDALQTEEGKYALGYILVEELKLQKTTNNREVHLGAAIFIDIEGQVKVGNVLPDLPESFKKKPLEDKIRWLLEKGFSEEQLIPYLNNL